MGRQSDIKNIFQNERVRSFVFWFVGLVVLDQLIKFLAFHYLKSSLYFFVSDERVLGLQLFKNYNFAFSLPLSQVIIFLIYGIVLAVLIWYVKKNFNVLNAKSFFAWTLILGGAISNILERIVSGYVKDFIFLLGGGIFNFADFYILLGIAILFFIELNRKNFKYI